MNADGLRLQLGRRIIIVFRLLRMCLPPSHQCLGLVRRLKDKAHSARLVTAALQLLPTNRNNDLKSSLGVPEEGDLPVPLTPRQVEARFCCIMNYPDNETKRRRDRR